MIHHLCESTFQLVVVSCSLVSNLLSADLGETASLCLVVKKSMPFFLSRFTLLLAIELSGVWNLCHYNCLKHIVNPHVGLLSLFSFLTVCIHLKTSSLSSATFILPVLRFYFSYVAY